MAKLKAKISKLRIAKSKSKKAKISKVKSKNKSKISDHRLQPPSEGDPGITIPDKKPDTRKTNIKIPTMDKLLSSIIKSKQTIPLLDSNKIRKYYHKTLNHLKKYNQDKLSALNEKISSHKIDSVKLDMLLNLFNAITNEPKKPIKKMTLRKVKPLKKGEHKCFSGYNIINTLGTGSFATAFLAEKNNQKYAIKEITIQKDPWSLSPDEQMKKIEGEVDTCKKMGELDIGPVLYDSYVCKEKGFIKVYMVMEHMTEGTLDTWLDNNVLTKSQKQSILSKLKKMHNKIYIHNDLHLQNIFVTKKKGKLQFYLGDFGQSWGPKDIHKNLHKGDLDIFNNSLKFKINNKYNSIIANLFIIWKLV